MQRNNKLNLPGILIVLLLLLLVAVAIAVIVRSCGTGGSTTPEEPKTSSSVPGNSDTGTGGSGSATNPKGSPNAAQPSSKPSPTPTPTPTPTPAPTPKPAAKAANGSMASNNTNGLNIKLDWSVADAGSGNVTLTLKLYAVSYSLYCRDIWHGAELSIGGKTYAFDTKAISYAGPGQGTNALGTHTVTIPATALGNATINWHFKGSYSGVDVPVVTASGKIG